MKEASGTGTAANSSGFSLRVSLYSSCSFKIPFTPMLALRYNPSYYNSTAARRNTGISSLKLNNILICLNSQT